MNNKQFANRIGNIDDRLVQEVGQKRSNQKEYKNMIRKFVSVAAVIALMLVSGAVGAYAFGRKLWSRYLSSRKRLTLRISGSR